MKAAQGRTESEKLQLLLLATCEAMSWAAFPRGRVDMQNKGGEKNNSVFFPFVLRFYLHQLQIYAQC